MKFFLFIIYFSVFIFAVWKLSFFNLKHISRHSLWFALLFKLIATVFFYYIYTFHYTERKEADIYRYFDDAKIMYSALPQNPAHYFKMLTGINDNQPQIINDYYLKMNNWYKPYDYLFFNDNRTMIRINAFFMLFSFMALGINILFFAIIGFLGILLIFKTIQFNNPLQNKLLFALFLFFPSLVFWTSAPIKETVVIFALGGFLFFMKRLTAEPFKFYLLVCMFIFLLLLLSIKLYVILSLIPSLIAYFLTKSSTRFIILKFIAVFSFYIILLWNFHHIWAEINFVEIFVRKQNDFINFAHSVDAGSIIKMKMLEQNIMSFISAIPLAFVNVLFSPLFYNSNNLLMFFVSVENLFFILLLILFLFVFNKKYKPSPLFYFNIFFSFLFFAVIGIATPVLGAIVRYKIIAYPFLFYALIAATDSDKINRIYNLLKHSKARVSLRKLKSEK